MDWSSAIVVILQLIFLEGILSIDNAAVLGAMVSRLPEKEPIPWPRPLHGLGRALDPLLGKQRMAALRVGLLGAYFGRGLMLLLASVVVQNPWLKIIGAIYLIRLAFDDLAAPGIQGMEEEGESKPIKVQGFWLTVLNVEIMDLVFSLDNVVAAVSLSDQIWVVMLGVAIGILAMRFAAGIFSYVVQKKPILKSAAYVLVLNIGIELLLEEIWHVEIGDLLRFGISVATIVLALVYDQFRIVRIITRPALVWLSQGFALVNAFVTWALTPPLALIKVIFHGVRRVFAPA